MKSIVSYPERGVGGSNKYRGNCSPKIYEDIIQQYKIKNISDYACGSNTLGDLASLMNKKGSNIVANTYDLRLGFDLLNDSIPERNENIFFHAPYWDIIKYSGNMWGNKPHPSDISHIKDYIEFMRVYNELVFKQFASLKTGGRMYMLMADVKKKGQLYSMLLDQVKIGTVEQIVIKAQHNCWSERQSYTNQNFIPIVHEYLLILRRDQPYLDKLKITTDYDFDIRDSKQATWRDVVNAVFEHERRSLSLNEVYRKVEKNKKARNNPHFKEKIRQVLNRFDEFVRVERGVYQLAS